MTEQIRSSTIAWLLIAAFTLPAAPAAAETLHVPSQYATIQEAIDAATDGDVVEIADGTYTGEGNKNLDFAGKPITVRGASGDPALCIIDCEGDGRGFYFHSGEGPDAIVEGLTITNGSVDEGGGGVFCWNCSPTLTNCTISGNSAANGGGVYCVIESNPTLTNCTISVNSAANDGGGVYCIVGSDLTLTNCTISENSAENLGGGVFYYGNPSLTNCILWGDTPQEIAGSSGNPVVTYCDVQDGWEGAGNIDVDPSFAFPDDFHLMPGSPCIDAGTNNPFGGLPAEDPDGNMRPLDGDGDTVAIADMGAYELNSAAPSIALSPPTVKFWETEGGADPPDQTLFLRNCGGETLNWEIAIDAPWLTASPPSGRSSGEVDSATLSVDISGKPHGVYTAVLEVADPQGVNSPRNVSVMLVVGRTLYVPGAYATIQAAIDAAADGDFVEIADGTYTGVGNKDLDFGGKAIAVRSASRNSALCIIDCEGDGRGFDFHSGEESDSVVEGLTITNGDADSGAGVRCSGSSPSLVNCAITGNSGWGGGVYCSYSSPIFAHCAISNNSSSRGAGVYCYEGAPTFADCTISGNSTDGDGGGVYCHSSSLTLANCTISGNLANSGGGGVYCDNSSPTLTNCTISGNSANNGAGVNCSFGNPALVDCTISRNSAIGSWGAGGGVYCASSSATLITCTISDNVASNGGGVNCSSNSSPMLANCTISGNSAWDGMGGGVYCHWYSSPTLTNCTISRNSAYRNGGGVNCDDYSDPTLTNCILWDDTPQEIHVVTSSPVVVYCDVQGGWPGEGNIDVDPFAFPDDPHLMSSSHCIDSGTNNPFGGLPADDQDGNERPLDGDGDTVSVADMGAYEFNPAAPSIALSPPTIKFSAPEGGSAPVDQVLSLRNCGGETLNWEITGQPGWLTASPASGGSSGEVDQVTLSVDISSLSHGSHTAVLEVADPQAVNSPREVVVTLYVTGTLHAPSEYPTIQAAIDAAIPGDEVVVADGRYTGDGNKDLDFDGKPITVRSASGAPALCVIDCEHDGRGFYFHNGEGPDSIVEGFTITNANALNKSGGGVYCRYGSCPTLSKCMISYNSADDYGGGVYCHRYSSPTLTDCTINENSADDHGGGVCCRVGSSPTLTNCTINRNSARYGGGVYCDNSSPTLINSTISWNVGASLYCYDNSSPSLTNCILWGDASQEILSFSSYPDVTYCDIQGGWAGEGNIDAEPLFALADDFHVTSGSPCIDAGTNNPLGGLPAEDPDGNVRPLDGDGDNIAIADIGAYEFNPAAPSIALSPPTSEFFGLEGEGNPPDQKLLLSNSAVGTLNWEITGQPAWLTTSPSAGDSSGEVDQVKLSVDITGLAHGLYAAVLEVVDPQAVNSPREVSVTLVVGRTLHVPSEYATIQAAIDAAIDGDFVEITDGTYTGPGNKDLDFDGKAITVRSVSGDPALCIIDCEGNGRGFHFHKGERSTSVVEGLTVANGVVLERGGGVLCRNSSPTLINCTMRGNSANYGGGVSCYDSGGPTLISCTIDGNSSDFHGGGFYCGGSGSSLTLMDCAICGNSANTGGGIGCSGGAMTLINCTFGGNLANYGGGAYCHESHLTLTNCTFGGNSAVNLGGGAYCYESNSTLTNCIFWGDAPQEIYADFGNPLVTYCNVQDGYTGEGNIDADPLFVDPDGPDDDPNTWEDNDYRLSAGSPCIDAGDNAAVPADTWDLDIDGDVAEPLPFDLDGRLRFADRIDTPDTGLSRPDYPELPIVDMGAYEYQCTGDVNGDGRIELGDLATLLPNFGVAEGAVYTDGDLDRDGDVDLFDLVALLPLFGTDCP